MAEAELQGFLSDNLAPGVGGGERSQGDFFLTLLISETEARDEEGGGDTGSAQ